MFFELEIYQGALIFVSFSRLSARFPESSFLDEFLER